MAQPDDKQQRHKDQLARWAGLHGFTPESGEVMDAFALAMGDNQYGVEETWDAYCWFRNGFNAAGAKLASSATALTGEDAVAAMDRSRRLWHRQCGLDGRPCPSKRECEAFNLGFKAALLCVATDGGAKK